MVIIILRIIYRLNIFLVFKLLVKIKIIFLKFSSNLVFYFSR